MNKNKIIEFIQTDSSLFVDTLIRGTVCLYNDKKESSVIVDLRSSKSDILWSLYDKKNIKYIDDIINVVSEINLTIFRTYFNLKNDVICIKDDKVLNHKNLFCFFEMISKLYDNVLVALNTDNINKTNSLISVANIVYFCSSNNPISFDNSHKLYIKFISSSLNNRSFQIVVFNTDINNKISNENVISIPFSLSVQQEVTNKNFLFNDNNNPFVKELNKFVNDIVISDNKDNIVDSIYEQHHSYIALKERLHNDLIKILNKSEDTNKIIENIKVQTEILLKSYDISLSLNTKQKIVKELCDDIAGLGVLEDFIKDESVTEIMVNGTNNIYVEKNGKIQETDIRFQSLEKLKIVIDKIASAVGRHIDEASPIVDARLKDGSRVNAVISPIALDGHTLTIRKFSKHKLKDTDLISFGSISKEMVDFLRNSVEKKKNILISGGTGTGKTTMLNVISSFIGAEERIVTIEDSAELQLHQKHVIRLETRAKSIEGTSEITIRQLVVNSLRMRPDRIIVGECRAGETIDMLQAMNTGHSGSMTTVHSNSPHDAVSRLLVMSLMSGIDLPEKAVISMIVSAIDIIVQIKRYPDGSRKVREISLIKKSTDNKYELVPVFIYNEQKNLFEKVLNESI